MRARAGRRAWEERPAKSLSTERNAVWRIIDAAANRAGEGLRVIEDYARFALDDRFLTAQCKSLRRDLAAALKVFPLSQRHAARETQADVGANLSLASEQARSGAKQVVVAGFQRVQQALRSLEEYAKTMEPDERCPVRVAALPDLHAAAGNRHRWRKFDAAGRRSPVCAGRRPRIDPRFRPLHFGAGHGRRRRDSTARRAPARPRSGRAQRDCCANKHAAQRHYISPTTGRTWPCCRRPMAFTWGRTN